MRSQNGKQSKVKNIFFFTLGLISVALAVAGFYYFDALMLPVRVCILIALLIIALLFLARTTWGNAFFHLLKDAKSELNKVVWPERKEAIQSTFMVFVMVFIMGIVLWATDSILFHLTAWVTQNVGG